MSNVDPTKPTSGLAYTADVRSNFAIIKQELEVLQGNLSGASEVNLFNQLTLAQQISWRAGTLAAASVYIQAAIDYASTLSAFAVSRNNVNVRLPAGGGDLDVQVTVKAHVNLLGEGVLRNTLVSNTIPCLLFKKDSHCSNLTINANGKAGVQFGEAGQACRMIIGSVIITGMGEGGGKNGVRFLGTG